MKMMTNIVDDKDDDQDHNNNSEFLIKTRSTKSKISKIPGELKLHM